MFPLFFCAGVVGFALVPSFFCIFFFVFFIKLTGGVLPPEFFFFLLFCVSFEFVFSFLPFLFVVGISAVFDDFFDDFLGGLQMSFFFSGKTSEHLHCPVVDSVRSHLEPA